MKSTQNILTLLTGFMPHAESRYGISRLGVFGSVARGEQTEDSDVDIYYEGKALSLLTIDALQRELEALLGCNVDTVRMRDNMNPVLRDRIRKEGIYVR
jgi:predicted nucleotidyltransferase